MSKSKTKIPDQPVHSQVTDSGFQMLNIMMVEPDPNQPRKHIDPELIAELRESIRERGILSPILVRPIPEAVGYMVVCGERRFTAARDLYRMDQTKCLIPCIVREMSDAEALELQIIENLHRKDITPMEEALAYRQVISSGTVNPDGLADKIGKTKKYVHQRLSLLNLIQEFQIMVDDGTLTLGKALKLARIPESEQRSIFEDDDLDNLDWRLKAERYKDLSTAPFDPSHATLVPNAGSCTVCQFNTANKPMLFDEVKSSRCSFSKCFESKVEAHSEIVIDSKIEQFSAVPVSFTSDKKTEAKILEKNWNRFGTLRTDWYQLDQQPDPVEETFEAYWQEHYSQKLEEADPDEVESAREEWRSERENFIVKSAEFNAKLSDPDYQVCVLVSGSDKGSIAVRKKTADSNEEGNTDSQQTAASNLSKGISALLANLTPEQAAAKKLDGLRKSHEELKRDSILEAVSSGFDNYKPGLISSRFITYYAIWETFDSSQKLGLMLQYGLFPEVDNYSGIVRLEQSRGEELLRSLVEKVTAEDLANVIAREFVDDFDLEDTGPNSMEMFLLKSIAEDCSIDVDSITDPLEHEFQEKNKDLIAQCAAIPEQSE